MKELNERVKNWLKKEERWKRAPTDDVLNMRRSLAYLLVRRRITNDYIIKISAWRKNFFFVQFTTFLAKIFFSSATVHRRLSARRRSWRFVSVVNLISFVRDTVSVSFTNLSSSIDFGACTEILDGWMVVVQCGSYAIIRLRFEKKFFLLPRVQVS